MFSFRDEFGQWDPKNQRPELWNLYNARVHKGEHVRVFPISNWTELDVWQYIARERLEVPSIYFAHRREVVRRGTLLVPVTRADAAARRRARRGRCRCAFAPSATSPARRRSRPTPRRSTRSSPRPSARTITERGATRLDDQTNEASMELRKSEGYF